MIADAVPFYKIIGKLSDLVIIKAIYTYENQNTFFTILLKINHAIYIKDMKHTLLCKNQSCEYGTIIGTFTISAGYYDFPLDQYGPTAYIHHRHLSEDELEHCPIIDIMGED